MNGGFTYVGTGTGAVTLSILGRGNTSQFAGEIDNLSVSSVPEPATWGLMLVGFGAVGAGLCRRRTAVSFG